MGKIILISFLVSFSFGNIFEKNCQYCHTTKQFKIFSQKYSLQYSNEKDIKESIFKFLKYPTSSQPLMPFEFIKKYGYKTASNLNDKELNEAIDTFYDSYKLSNFIK